MSCLIGNKFETFVAKSPLCCATLLPVKIRQLFRNIFRPPNFRQNFTGKSVAHQESPFYY